MNDSESLQPQPELVEPDILRQFLGNQAQELYLQQQERVLRERELANTHDYALKLLEAQLTDRQQEREAMKSYLSTGGRFMVIIVLAIIGGIIYALYLNKDQIVIELIKAILYIVSGAIGGYSLKSLRGKKDEPKE